MLKKFVQLDPVPDLSYRLSHPHQNRNSKWHGKRRQLALGTPATTRRDCWEGRNQKLIKADTRTQKSELHEHLVPEVKLCFLIGVAFSVRNEQNWQVQLLISKAFLCSLSKV